MVYKFLVVAFVSMVYTQVVAGGDSYKWKFAAGEQYVAQADWAKFQRTKTYLKSRNTTVGHYDTTVFTPEQWQQFINGALYYGRCNLNAIRPLVRMHLKNNEDNSTGAAVSSSVPEAVSVAPVVGAVVTVHNSNSTNPAFSARIPDAAPRVLVVLPGAAQVTLKPAK